VTLIFLTMRLLTHQITAPVDPEMFDAVVALAADDEVTRAEVMRRSLELYLRERGAYNGDDAEGPTSASSELPARVPPG
jgi:hypothetical protein